MENLTIFISNQRGRFETKANNLFSFSWGKVTKRMKYLKLIGKRYSEVSQAFIENQKRFSNEAQQSGDGEINETLEHLINENESLTNQLHLEIESSYLFAKIILDDIARAFEFYFGAERNLAIDSHDDFNKAFDQYLKTKGIKSNEALRAKVSELKEKICDYRDYKIAHEKSPRTLSGTSWDKDGKIRMILSRIYPKDTETEHSASETPTDMIVDLESYIQLITDFITLNQELSCLPKLENSVSQG